MNIDQVYDSINGRTLSESILQITEDVEYLNKNNNLLTYANPLDFISNAAQITFENLIKKMPAKSILIFDAAKSSYPLLDIPGSGLVKIERGSYKSKAYIEFTNEYVQLYRMYNSYFASAPLQPWIARGVASYSMTAADLGGLLSNIKVSGSDVYIVASEAVNITDKPANVAAGGLQIKTTWFNGSRNDVEQILTENSRVGRAWRRVNGLGRGYTDWIPIPMLIRGSGQKWYVRAGDMYIDDAGETFLMTNAGLVAIK